VRNDFFSALFKRPGLVQNSAGSAATIYGTRHDGVIRFVVTHGWLAGVAQCHSRLDTERELTMRRQLIGLLVGGAFVATSGAVMAHHSFAMFDQENPIDLVGTVKEFKFTSPHTFILLQVKQPDGTEVVWNLEGGSPSALVRDGWSSKTLPPGTELQMKIDPLRSGAPGGAWNVNKTKLKDGKPIAVTH